MVRRGSPLRAALGARQAEGVERGTRVPEKRQPVGLGYEQKRFLERFGNNTMNSDAFEHGRQRGRSLLTAALAEPRTAAASRSGSSSRLGFFVALEPRGLSTAITIATASINARAETLATSSSMFRDAFRRHRCPTTDDLDQAGDHVPASVTRCRSITEQVGEECVDVSRPSGRQRSPAVPWPRRPPRAAGVDDGEDASRRRSRSRRIRRRAGRWRCRGSATGIVVTALVARSMTTCSFGRCPSSVTRAIANRRKLEAVQVLV